MSADKDAPSGWLPGCHTTPTDRRKLRRLNVMVLLWAVVFVAGSFMARHHPDWRALGYSLVALTGLLGIAVVAIYVDYLRTADELLRKIQLEALGLAFGAGWVFTFTYRMCQRLGAPALDIDDPMLVMILVWVVAQFLGARRYR